MARIFITGSSDGLGQVAARRLVALGHDVVLHGRNSERARQALQGVPGARAALAGDLSSLAETRKLAEQANDAGPFQAVIHNAGVYLESARRVTVDGLNEVFAVDAVAPYLLTALMEHPQRLIYVSSGLHEGGDADVKDLVRRQRRWPGYEAYANSKLFEVALAFAIARLWPQVRSNALDPGWVPTKMGGPSASDSLEEGAETQVWLAVSDEPGALVTGRYFYHKRVRRAHPAASSVAFQDAVLAALQQITGVELAPPVGSTAQRS